MYIKGYIIHKITDLPRIRYRFEWYINVMRITSKDEVISCFSKFIDLCSSAVLRLEIYPEQESYKLSLVHLI